MKEKRNSFFSLRKKEKDKLRFGFTSTYIAMISVIGILFLYYIFSINISSTKGYTIRDLEMAQRDLKIELQKLDVQIAELESLDNILKDPIVDQMEAIEDPNYVVIREWVQYVYQN